LKEIKNTAIGMLKFLPEVCYTKNSAQTYQILSQVGGIRVQDYNSLALVGVVMMS